MAIDINIPSQVKTFANLAAFPATGALKTIYIAEDTNKTYRWTGSVYVEVSAAGATGITIGTTAIASGTVGRVLFEGTGNVVQESANLFWDNTNNRLGIGTSTAPSGSVYIDNSGNDIKQHLILKNSNAGSSAQVHLDLHNNVSGSSYSSGASLFLCSSTTAAPYASALGFWNYLNAPIVLATNATERMRIASTGNVLINTTTDAGFKLDVNGTARVKGTGTTFATTSFSVINNANTSALSILDNLSVYFGGEIFGPTNFYINGPTNGTGTIHLRPAILNLSTATVQYNGTQFLGTGSGADLRIGSVAVGYNSLSMYVSGAERMRISSGGNLLINTTTDAGFRLDVNGTARFSGNVELPTTSLILQAGISGFAGSGNVLLGNNFNIRAMNSSNTGTMNLIKSTSGNNIEVGGSNHGNTFINPTLNSGQTVVVGDNVVVASAVLNVSSTTKGFLPPRMTTTQKNAIATPAAGLQVYDTTLNQMSYYNGTTWTNI
jgi:hypothetical protein